jgi:hypothetical protein
MATLEDMRTVLRKEPTALEYLESNLYLAIDSEDGYWTVWSNTFEDFTSSDQKFSDELRDVAVEYFALSWVDYGLPLIPPEERKMGIWTKIIAEIYGVEISFYVNGEVTSLSQAIKIAENAYGVDKIKAYGANEYPPSPTSHCFDLAGKYIWSPRLARFCKVEK